MSLARKACLWTSLPSWPVVSGAGRALLDADHLELIGYVGETIGAEGTPVVALVGAKRCGRDAYARYGHVHDQYGGLDRFNGY